MARVAVLTGLLALLACGGGGGESAGDPPGGEPPALPPLLCTDTPANCTELVPFEPDAGEGYIDLLLVNETPADERYSYVRRDVMQALKYAAAKVARLAAGWTPGNGAPAGIAHMSEWDGATPGVGEGMPLFPIGTYENGSDVSVAYYQVGTADNDLRAVCPHTEGVNDAFRCTAAPDTLDARRTALFIAALAEHPELRVVGVDPLIGPVLEAALNDLVTEGVLDATFRTGIPLVYGTSWEFHHHHHYFVGFQAP